MRRILIILTLCVVSASMWGIVPPRDPADTVVYHQRVQAMRKAGSKAPAREEAVGTARVFPRVPVILVSYPNMPYRVSKAAVDSMFNAEHFDLDGATGSVRKYFYDQSNGAYNPRFDIYGPVTVSGGFNTYANSAPKLVLEACALMDDSLDFTLYDTDGDGKVDLTYCLYAGPPASDGNYIDKEWISNPDALVWPHYYTISYGGTSGLKNTFDGKTIDDYEVSSELDGTYSNAEKAVMAGVGLACHEFGHGLGLPDLYETNSDYNHNCKTLGSWDIMDYGCYNNDVHTPPCYSAYERWFMGWLTPQLLNQAADVTLQNLGSAHAAAYITESGEAISNISQPYPNVFYMVENRQQTGWDEYLPGHGLIITKINYKYNWWTGNSVNNSASKMGVDILEADGLTPSSSQSGFLGKPGDAYPTGASEFTKAEGYPITEIKETNGVITFKFMGGGEDIELDVESMQSSDISIQKVMHNGRLIIIRDNTLYDILGKKLYIQ